MNYRRPAGIHITISPWLPAPAPGSPRHWNGWIQLSPREFGVHPAALENLLVEIRRLLGDTVQIHYPEKAEAIILSEAQKTSPHFLNQKVRR